MIKISTDEKSKLKILPDEKNKSKTFSFDFQLNEVDTKEKKKEKHGVNIDSSILKNKVANNQEKNNLLFDQKNGKKTIKINLMNFFDKDKDFQDFKTLVSNKEKLISSQTVQS